MDFVDNTGERVRIFLFFVENIIFNYFKRESLYISSTSVIKGHPDSISKKKTLSFNLLYYETISWADFEFCENISRSADLNEKILTLKTRTILGF